MIIFKRGVMLERIGAVTVMGILFLFAALGVGAQAPVVIPPVGIAVGAHQTTQLIFPYGIKSVNRGSGEVIAQITPGVDNILQVKAAKAGFVPTNLSVVTADRRFYSFMLTFSEAPGQLNYCFGDSGLAQLSGGVMSARELEKTSWRVLGERKFLRLSARAACARLGLPGVFLGAGSLWLRLHLHNQSQVDFAPDYVRCYLRDRRRVKRTAVQEREIVPIYRDTPVVIPGERSGEWAMCFTPFTVPPDQVLVIQVGERAGGRQLTLRVKGKFILRARRLAAY